MTDAIGSLAIDDRGERVSMLQDGLAKLGYKIPAHEVKAKLFGVGTRDALLAFQRKSRLRKTGRVDDRTEIALTRNVAAAEGGKRLIEGRIVLENGVPAVGIPLRFLTIGYGGARKAISETRTDEGGFYAFAYGADKAWNNVEVAAPGARREEIALSEPKCDLDSHEILKQVVPSTIQPRLPGKHCSLTHMAPPER
jgi:peptidoglycan hydrolase-like protein with peptidoglycan-binding domain